MKFRFLLILIIAGFSVQAQTNYTKWALEAGGGIHGSSDPYSPGYFQESINLPQLFLGGRYMFNENVGLRMTLGYLSMNEGEDSEEFDSSYLRASLEGLLDLNQLLEMWEPESRFTILLHAGGGISRMSYDLNSNQFPDPGEANTDRADNLVHFTGGVMPQYRINDRISVFADVSYFGHLAQSYTWDGYSAMSEVPGGDGGIWMASIGIVFNLQSARSRWDCRSLY